MFVHVPSGVLVAASPTRVFKALKRNA